MIYNEKEAAQMRAAWWALDLVGSDTKLSVLADALYIEKAKQTAICAGELPEAGKVIYPEHREERPKLRAECNQKVAQFLIDHSLMEEHLIHSSSFMTMLSREQLESMLSSTLKRLRVPTIEASYAVSLQDFHTDLYYIQDPIGYCVEVDAATYHAIPDAHVVHSGASEPNGEVVTPLSTHTCDRTKQLSRKAFDDVKAGLDQPLKREHVLIRIEGHKP